MNRLALQFIQLFLFINTIALFAWAQQQALPQHARIPDEPVPQSTPVDSEGSSITLSWNPIPFATHYRVKLSRDIEMIPLAFEIDTVSTALTTPVLAPGAYYYIVVGLGVRGEVGDIPVQRIVIGKAVSIAARRPKLSTPAIIAPTHLQEFPARGAVRLAWEPVKGARGYRFRLWNEDQARSRWTREKKETLPIWTTEIEQPWLELHDAPYSSFQYLDSGVYRWDVAAIDATSGEAGHTALGFFQMGHSWFFPQSENLFRFFYGLTPHASYQSSSANTGTQFSLQGPSHRLDFESEFWFSRNWGLGVDGGLRTFSITLPMQQKATSTLYFYHASLDLWARAFFSTVPYGWWIDFLFGLGLEEFPILDASDPIRVSRPKGLGPRLGFRLHKRFDSPWEGQLESTTLLSTMILSGPAGGSEVGGALNSDVTARALYHWDENLATSLGLRGEFRKLRYVPKGNLNYAEAVLPNWVVWLGLQLDLPKGQDKDTIQKWRPR